MSDTALNKYIQYGIEADRLAFVPNPASGSQILYFWYQPVSDTEPAGLYAWFGSGWLLVNPVPPPGSFYPNPKDRKMAYIPFVPSNVTPGIVGFPSPFTSTSVGGWTDASDNDYSYTRMSTSGVLNNAANWRLNTSVFSYVTRNNPKLFARIKTGASVADIRILFVLSNSNTPTSDAITANHIAIRYSTSVPDGGWVGSCNNGSGQQVTPTILAIAPSTMYELEIDVINNGTEVIFTVNGVSRSLTVNLPANNLALTPVFAWVTLAAAVKSIDHNVFTLEYN